MKNITTLLILLYCFIINAQTPITNDNFLSAIDACLATNSVDGMCSGSQYGAMPTWDVSNVSVMSYAFADRNSFNGDISSWDVSSVTNMEEMFGRAFAFSGDISSWNVSSVTDMYGMFSSYNSAFNQDIGDWNTSSVIDMGRMFYGSSAFNQDIGNWAVDNVTYCVSFSFDTPQWTLPQPNFTNCNP